MITYARHEDFEKYQDFAKDPAFRSLHGDDVALLEDRLALRQGKKQIYGSQVSLDNQSGKYYVENLQDPENVDKRRAAVGLPPLAEYLKQWGINWNVEEYKRKMKDRVLK